MTSPRIYVYKITFDEVSHYYYGVHKEKRFDEYYMGSPVTHKNYWELYTPKKECIEFFEYSDEGYIKARIFEDSLIAPVLNDEFCLNEHVGGFYSLETLREVGKLNYERGLGIHALTREERSENGKRGGKNSSKIHHNQRWQCTVTGFISTASGLVNYQFARGIDKSNRVRLYETDKAKELRCQRVSQLMEDARILFKDIQRNNEVQKWKVTFVCGKYEVIAGSLSTWAKENGYITHKLNKIREGRSTYHRGIIKVVPF
jgi:hypothetical protein